jgi:ribosomal peptide maturation radical SAM protein 1
MYDARALLRPAEVLLVVPPFAWLDRPALGVHLLQALARRAGVETQVLYASALFAAWFGEASAVALSRTQYSLFLGERMFARAAFGTPPLGHDGGASIDPTFAAAREDHARAGVPFVLSRANLLTIEAGIADWLDSFVPAIAGGGYRVVGCTSSFEQTAASLAILAGVKRRAPATLTALGGANCEGEMARGLAELCDVDAIFSGESERSFVRFLETVRAGGRPARIHDGEPCTDLDALPPPDYADYYAQLGALLPASLPHARLTYETSRGCWWGEKSHCTFCGLNGQGMASRHKSPDHALAELGGLLAHHPNRDVVMTDNIMPHGYWKTFVSRLAGELPGVRMVYEIKANLTLGQVAALARAGIREIQPGIEALSTGLLQLMAKGTTCAQNLALLRYAAAAGLQVHWNVLYGFPGDRLRFYEDTLALVPLITHLPPPFRLNRVIIDRFSPYHDHPGRHGVASLRAIPPYRAWLPEGAPHEKLAYHFEAVFASEALDNPDLMEELAGAIAAWRRAWVQRRPARLAIVPAGPDLELIDTRGLPGLPEVQVIDEDQALAALVGRSITAPERAGDAWARAHQLVVERDRKLVPLAVASLDLLAAFEARAARRELVVLPAPACGDVRSA